ncbi:TlpA disulfide reductase family protein [Candidatus Parabeggiatoa sp. HSG14]|uniref:TlpA family protein disulfide reductase n=1 Tax=Candidatus Parabeggiatoa sp. HSG14 TaxID=3055593 RepID=UPI0025A7092D|nr:TlpA disulfide reductase family protein [Thiotrichales bacterium HSG14]
MKRLHWFLLIAIAVVSMVNAIVFFWYSPKTSEPQPITHRPTFSFPDLQGKTRTNTEWDGKIVIVNFWATWCPPCIREIPLFIKLQKKYGYQGLQFVGITFDKFGFVKNFVNETGMNYPSLIGEQGKVITLAQELGNQMGVLPYTVIIDRKGNIILRHPGEMDQAQIERIISPLL